jgi:hypothetical protein
MSPAAGFVLLEAQKEIDTGPMKLMMRVKRWRSIQTCREMPSPGALADIPAVPLFARITHEPVGLIERKRLAAMENPHAALLLQRRAAAYRLQGDALAFGLEGNNNTAGFVDGDSRGHNANMKWHYANVKWQCRAFI